jgi:hypothetical protein
MIVLVRPFSVTHETERYKVLYIHEDKEGRIHYCVVDRRGNQRFLDAEQVVTVQTDE